MTSRPDLTSMADRVLNIKRLTLFTDGILHGPRHSRHAKSTPETARVADRPRNDAHATPLIDTDNIKVAHPQQPFLSLSLFFSLFLCLLLSLSPPPINCGYCILKPPAAIGQILPQSPRDKINEFAHNGSLLPMPFLQPTLT